MVRVARMVVLAAVVALLVVACGDATNTSDVADEEVTTTVEPRTLTAAELDAALLEDGDLPPDWSTTNDVAYGGPEEVCAESEAPLKTEQHEMREAFFGNRDTGQSFLQSIITAPDAEEHFADLRRVVESCLDQTWTEQIDDGQFDLTLTEEPALVPVGDESASYRLEGHGETTATTFTMGGYIVLSRTGSVAAFYMAFGLEGSQVKEPGSPPVDVPDKVDPQQMYELVDAGEAKIEANSQGA